MKFLKNKEEGFSSRNFVYIGVFLVLFALYVFLLFFYQNKIINKLKEINSLKTQIGGSEKQWQEYLKIQRINNLIKQETGKDLPAILYEVRQKIDRDFENTKKLIVDKLNKENWQIKTTNFQSENKILEITFELPVEDTNKFFNFLVKEGLLWQIQNLNISKETATIQENTNSLENTTSNQEVSTKTTSTKSSLFYIINFSIRTK